MLTSALLAMFSQLTMIYVQSMRTPNGLDAHPSLTRRLQHSDLTPDYHLLTNISTVNSKLGYPITLTPMSATSPATPSEQASLLSSAP